ncbi:MAG: DUF2194 domain-containing protein [Myxococcales bacterium]|nr:DUF2194 domain-containing protein [Myxococcales bacterium]
MSTLPSLSSRVAALVAALLCVAPQAFARLLDRPVYLSPSTTVLGLYDSTDPTRRGVDSVLPRAKAALEQLGLSLQLHDISGTYPAPETLRSVRAIITAFDDPAMPNAQQYQAWLAQQIDAGKRLVILGNFGAWQDSDTKEWVDGVNAVFRRLGVSAQGDWTDVVSNLRVVGTPNATIVTHVDLAASAHFQLFRVVDAAVKAHLVIERTDKPKSQSAVVFTGPRGGMALERYDEADDGKSLIDLKAFLSDSLFPALEPGGRVLAVIDPDVQSARRMEDNLQWVFRYSRVQADFVSFDELGKLTRRDFRRYGAVLIGTDGGDNLGPEAARSLESWVKEDGGGLVTLMPLTIPAWDPMLGIAKRGDGVISPTGMRVVGKLYPGLDGMVIADRDDPTDANPRGTWNVIGTVPDLALKSDCVRLVVTTDPEGQDVDGSPVLWTRTHGKGHVAVRNDYASVEKIYRGQILQLIQSVMPISAVPIVNAGVYFMDDAPQPMWDVKRYPIEGEYGISDTDFYRDVWWPDMLALAKEFDIKYTFVLIFSYDDATSKGFTADPFYASPSKGVPLQIAREVIAQGHEMGFHGYNHQSLVHDKGYTSAGWPTREAMVESLRLARSEWERLFGPGHAPFTYIAPNNHIHRAGKEAVKIVFPEIRVMAAQYLDEGDIEGGEWDTDPDVAQFMGMPRVSSEFYLGTHNNVGFHDSLMLGGLWTHFVHPDDVYDPGRNGGMAWKSLRESQRAMFQHLKKNYPWLRSMTARDAYYELVRYRTDPFHAVPEAGGIRIAMGSGSTATRWFQVKVPPSSRAVGKTNATLRHAYPDYGIYIFEGTGPEAYVAVEGGSR